MKMCRLAGNFWIFFSLIYHMSILIILFIYLLFLSLIIIVVCPSSFECALPKAAKCDCRFWLTTAISVVRVLLGQFAHLIYFVPNVLNGVMRDLYIHTSTEAVSPKRGVAITKEENFWGSKLLQANLPFTPPLW